MTAPRYGAVARVRNDVRGALLLVALMFLAASVAFDEPLALDPRATARTSSAGWS